MKRERKKGTLWMVLGGVLLTAALLLSVYNLYDAYRAEQSVLNISEALREQVAEKQQEDAEEIPETVPDYILYPEKDMPIVEIDGETYIGFLEIPQLELSLPIIGEEWSYAKLKKAPCLYEGSIYMNDMIIAGHNYRSHFSKLKTLEPGAEIYFIDAAGNTFEYILAWTEIIQKSDIDGMLSKDEEWDLTLFTCTYGGGERYTLRCMKK